eukprot:TRINITY_DN82_c3_g1_i1.p1 TRINITY_DN82_c3_g1~~TRINITY_DN82_c3_g1_i1.p1  ORF type:complete len:318 (-),score=139.04 TRINITY_DN82_c3_g1_i1:98-1051(-)
MSTIKISHLFVYPVKSCGGFEVNSWKIDERGFELDRHWMIVNPSGVFITQRQRPKMCFIQASLTDQKQLILTAPSMQPFHVPLIDETQPNNIINVEVWKQQVPGVDQGEEVANWLSSFLEIPCRLVKMPNNFNRIADSFFTSNLPTSNNNSVKITYCDGFPFHLTSKESLDWLNTKLTEATHQIEMEQFRPNIVVQGCDQPFAEDTWKTIDIIQSNSDSNSNSNQLLTMYSVKPCQRCILPNVIRASAQRSKEPLVTLRNLRTAALPHGNVPIFGQNLVHNIQQIKQSNQSIQLMIGSTIQITEYQQPPTLVKPEDQ